MKTLAGSRNFRLRIVVATILHTPIKIEKIRPNDTNPGLRDFEVSFLRLVESLTSGSVIEISYTGTTVVYKPGLIIGGEITFHSHPSRAIGYYLEFILLFSFFCKKKLSVVVHGVDADRHSPGLEGIKWGYLPILNKFGLLDVELKILKRGAAPEGGAIAHLLTNQLINAPLTLHHLGKIHVGAIRGVAYSTRVSPGIVNRIVESVRSSVRVTNCKTDIFADCWRGENSGNSPGWGITLVAEGKNDRVFVELMGGPGETPEDVGRTASLRLLEEISVSGAFCRAQLQLVVPLMMVGKENVGRISVHKRQLDSALISVLRDMKILTGSEVFVSEEDDEYATMVVKGVGIVNSNRKIA